MANPAHAATFTVNSTTDAGDQSPGNGSCSTGVFIQVGPRFVRECTLRAAIQETNANDNNAAVLDAIHFSIPGAGPHTISPASFLPQITEAVVIDGYTEPDASENTQTVGNDADLRIRLSSGSVNAGSGLWIAADDSAVRGLSITGFSSGDGLILSEDRITVEGNFIGTAPGGTQTGLGNFTGITVQGNSSDTIVGGISPGARNIISGNIREGVRISTNPGEARNKVQGNYIGTTKNGSDDLGNGAAGVIADSSENLVGGGTPDAANTIAFNGGDGVQVGDNFIPKAIRIQRNSIFSNGGLGIDLLGPDENFLTNVSTPNDPGDADSGPNNLQNFPVLTSAVTSSGTTIRGTLNSTPNRTFTVQFFSNPSGNEGRTFISAMSVTTNGKGNAPFTFTPKQTVAVGQTITATGRDAEGNTSEFSASRAVTAS